MAHQNLPPQAYTKETVAKAYNWLQSQAPDVKARATSPDALVSLYLRAKRGMDVSGSTEAPVSSKTFRDDLKNLATELDQFNPQSSKSDNSPTSGSPTANIDYAFNNVSPPQTIPGPQPNVTTTRVTPQPKAKADTEVPSPKPEPTPSHSVSRSVTFSEKHDNPPMDLRSLLDARSYHVISEVKNRLNLSSDVEVLRFLITLGYERAKTILPEDD